MIGMIENNKLIIGWREWVALPELGIPAVKAKIDTGARTSALDTFSLETFTLDGKLRARFGVHPVRRRPDIKIFCIADVIDERIVTNSGGRQEQRLVIRTPVRMGHLEWPIEITLANRESMRFRMLLGRSALNERVLVDTDASYLIGNLRHLYPARRPKPKE
jgi:hypothetical protein